MHGCYTAPIMSLAATRHSDTTPEAERVLTDLYRAMPPWRKAALVADAIRTARTLAFAGVQSRYPEESIAEQRRRLVELLLGAQLAAKLNRR